MAAESTGMEHRIVLASGSEIRHRLLTMAGVAHAWDTTSFEESELKQAALSAPLGPAATALLLAKRKAMEGTKRHPEAWVIGADQVLDFEGSVRDKPTDLASARAVLHALRGKTHRLISAVAVASRFSCLWKYAESAVLTMRPLSDSFVEHYLESEGTDILRSVGAYRIEGKGVQLFSRFYGDYFTILGLPLLPLLDFLRRSELIPE
jgi:septum formation protein